MMRLCKRIDKIDDSNIKVLMNLIKLILLENETICMKKNNLSNNKN